MLLGKVTPGGKLPVTFPRTVGQAPIYYNHKNTGRPAKDEDKYTSKYIDAPWTPLFPFGYGLSYTTFRFSDLDGHASGDSAVGTGDRDRDRDEHRHACRAMRSFSSISTIGCPPSRARLPS